MQSDVVITGYRLNAKEPAAKALERILGLSSEAARTLARGFPAVVLERVANDNAERIRDQLVAAGALVELRASQSGIAPRPHGLAEPRRERFAHDLESAVPASEAARGAGALAIPLPPRPAHKTGASPRASLPARQTGRMSLPQPPAPPPEAYRLGGFDLGPRGQSVVAPLPTAPSSLAPAAPDAPAARRAPGDDMELELGMGGSGLELDLPLGPENASPMGGRPSTPRSTGSSPDPQLLGERFDDVPQKRAPRAPDVDPQAMRQLQRGRMESRRPAPKRKTWLQRVGESALPGLLLLLALTAVTALAVGYAIDPEDPVRALARGEGLLPEQDPPPRTRRERGLHPLLAAMPVPARPPLATLLRTRVTGVHDVPVSFPYGMDRTAHCCLVEHAEGQTEARLARVRETGREVAPSADVSAQLLEHERALRAMHRRADMMFTRVCLVD